MDSRYFDVSDVWDSESGDRKYENLSKNALRDSVSDYDEKFEEKISDVEELHKFTKGVLEELGLDNLGMELESVVEKLVDGEDFSDIYSDWEDNQYDFMEPAYNYVYPLNYAPTTEQCVQVAKETNAVVIEVDREYYIALCGAGMDMSQDIGYAKGVICGNTLSLDDCRSINTQKSLTISEDKYYALMEKIEESLETHISSAEYKLKEIKELLPKKEETHLDKIVKDFEDKNSPKKEDDVVDSNESKKVRRDR